MIRNFVRYFTSKVSIHPKPLAPNKPKASIDFVSKDEDDDNGIDTNVFCIG